MKTKNLIKCAFDIGFHAPIQEIIDKAKAEIIKAGGKFEGNTDSGNYSVPTIAGRIVGTYKVQGNTIHFEISQKPSIVSCKTIQNKLDDILSFYFDAQSHNTFSGRKIFTGPNGGKYYINSRVKKTYIKQK
jgi:hypothetical protein